MLARADGLASMGPPTFIGGNYRWAETARFQALFASMGPPTFIGGNVPVKALALSTWPASMGPPTFIGGNRAMEQAVSDTRAASMGPPTFIGGNTRAAQSTASGLPLQWGRRLSSAEIDAGGVRSGQAFVASMGPPTFIGGNKGSARRTFRSPARFNGAADFHRRKLPVSVSIVVPINNASMGPPTFIGGNTGDILRVVWGIFASMGPPTFIGGNGAAPG